MTMLLSRRAFPERSLRFTDPETVERFLAEERESAKLDERHRGAYGQRLVATLPIDEIFSTAAMQPVSPGALAAAHAALYGPELDRSVARAEELQRELESIARALGHAYRERHETFSHRGFVRPLGEARALAQPLEAELERIGAWRDAWDRRVCEVHARMALDVDAGLAAELRVRYAFHLALQDLRRHALRAASLLEPAVAARDAQVALAPEDQELAMRHALEARAVLADLITRSESLVAPALPNLALPAGLARFLAPSAVVSDPSLLGSKLAREAIDAVARQHAEIVDRLERVRKKSLAGLVAMHDTVAARWRAPHVAA